MRAIIISIFCFFFAFSLSAQVDMIKEVNFVARNMSLDKALNRLSNKTNISIAFSDKLIPDDMRITVRFRNKPFQSVLEYLLRGTGLGYKVIGDQVVLFKAVSMRKFTLSGYLKDASNGERLIACHIIVNNSFRGTTTNDYGFYSLTLPEGKVSISFSYLGYQMKTLAVDLNGNKRMDVELKPVLNIQEILVIDDDSTRFRSFDLEHLSPQMISSVPSLGGEPDLIRVAQFMPGVQTGADGLGGIHVRGGNADQNLYLLDGVPIYNVSHLAGIFSIYDVDAVRSSQLLKDFIPARYGGRLSSVLDVRTREGNSKEWKGKTSVGLASIKASVEGPLVKNKGAFFLSARRALLDLVMKSITRDLKADRNESGFSNYHFYDLNAKFNYTLSAKDQVYFSMYNGRDNFYDESQTIFEDEDAIDPTRFENQVEQTLNWGNTVGALRWNHLFSPKLFLNTTFTFSKYRFKSESLAEELVIISDVGSQPDTNRNVLYTLYQSKIEDWAVKADFDYVAGPNHYWRFGFEGINHTFQPGVTRSEEEDSFPGFGNSFSDTSFIKVPTISGNEFSVYLEDQWAPSGKWKTNVGLRGTAFSSAGHTWWRVEPRGQIWFQAGHNWRLKSSYNLLYQYMHLLTSSGIGLPNDLWVPSSAQVAPQRSWQALIGMEAKLLKRFMIGVDLYYKKLDDLIAYQEGSNLASIDARNWEEKITVGEGASYGLEVSMRKRTGAFTGLLTYTWSKATRQFDDINLGQTYPFRYDRRHNLKLNGHYQINEHLHVAANWVYSTGLAVTLPIGEYEFSLDPFIPIPAIVYSEKNSIRLPDYHRLDLDLGYLIKGKKVDQKINLGVYNIYNRKNPVYYRVGRDPEDFNKKRYLRATLFQLLPYFSYRISF